MKDKLLQWKAEYGIVYQLEIEDHSIFYRTLNAWEIQALIDIREKKSSSDLELSSCLLAVLEPTPLPTFKKPGSISTLSAAIWDKSIPSLEDLPQKTEQARAWAEDSLNNNFSIVLSSGICKSLPSIDFVNLLSLPLPQLLRIAALVEKITNVSILSKDDNQGTPNQANIPVSDQAASEATQALSSALSRLKTSKK